MLLTFYILLGFYFTVVITHAFTKASIEPKVTENDTIRVIKWYHNKTIKFQTGFIIEVPPFERDPARLKLIREEIVEREKMKLLCQLPKEMITLYEQQDWQTGNIKAQIEIRIVDPTVYR